MCLLGTTTLVLVLSAYQGKSNMYYYLIQEEGLFCVCQPPPSSLEHQELNPNKSQGEHMNFKDVMS